VSLIKQVSEDFPDITRMGPEQASVKASGELGEVGLRWTVTAVGQRSVFCRVDIKVPKPIGSLRLIRQANLWIVTGSLPAQLVQHIAGSINFPFPSAGVILSTPKVDSIELKTKVELKRFVDWILLSGLPDTRV